MPDLEEWRAADLLAVTYSQDLVGVGTNGRYHYRPKSPTVARLAATLAQTHAEHPAAILEEVTRISNPTPLRSFVHAFVVKKKRTDR